MYCMMCEKESDISSDMEQQFVGFAHIAVLDASLEKKAHHDEISLVRQLMLKKIVKSIQLY